MNTIHRLRKTGYKVRVKHYRYSKGGDITALHTLKETKSVIEPRGGLTVMEITTPDGRTFRGGAKCHMKDNFCYRISNSICLGRIAKENNLDLGVKK